MWDLRRPTGVRGSVSGGGAPAHTEPARLPRGPGHQVKVPFLGSRASVDVLDKAVAWDRAAKAHTVTRNHRRKHRIRRHQAASGKSYLSARRDLGGAVREVSPDIADLVRLGARALPAHASVNVWAQEILDASYSGHA